MSVDFQGTSLGYDPAAADSDQLQAHQTWFDSFFPPPFRSGPRAGDGDVCEPHLFAAGDTFATSHQLFNWTVQRVDPRSFSMYQASKYRAFLTLDSCDISKMAITMADSPALSIWLKATIRCTSTDFPVTATTAFSIEDGVVLGMASDARNGDPVPEQVKSV